MPKCFFCKEWFFTVMLFVGIPHLQAQQVDSTAVYDLSEVEVMGKVRPSQTRQGSPFQSLDRLELDRLGMQDLSEAVKHMSGVIVKDYGGIGGLKTVSIRSLGAQHTAVSYDGVTITDAQSGQIDISRFALDNVETVSLTIGQSDNIFRTARLFASAGALSIETSKPIFTDKSFRLCANIKGGSFGLFNPVLRYEQKFNPVFSASVHFDWLRAKGEYPFTLVNENLITQERRKNSDIQSFRTEGNLYADFQGAGTLQAKIYYFDSERGLPGSVILYNEYAKERLWDHNFFTQLHYKNTLNDNLSLQAQAKYNYTYSKYRDVNPKYADGWQEDRNRQEEYYASVGLLYQLLPTLSFSLVTDLAHTSLRNNFTAAPQPVRWTSLSVLAAQYATSRVTATASLLGTYMTDKVKQGGAPADRKRLSPAFSVSVRPFAESNLRVRLSYQDIFRAPTFTDYYYTRMGNVKLRPEKATQYNLGITWGGAVSEAIRHMTLSADAYYNRVEDKIVATPTMYLWKMTNVGEVDIRGVDINWGTECVLSKQFVLMATAKYSYQRAIDVTDPESKTYHHQIVYTPRHSGSGSLALENPWVNIAWNVTGMDDRYSLAQNIETNRVAGYVEHGFSLNKTIAVGAFSFRIQGEVLNLTDKMYDIIRYYPMPGRSWRLSVNIMY